MTRQKTYSVPALEKAIWILNLLASNHELSITEIHVQLALPKSSTYALLSTLEEHAYVEKTHDGRYQLGHGVFPLGMAYYHRIDIRRVARPHLQTLVEGTPFTAHLAVLINYQAVYVDKVEGNGFVRFATEIGQSHLLHLSGVGKALAAGLTDEEICRTVEYSLSPLTPKSPRSIEAVLEDIRFVREHGYSIEDEQMESGIRCIGAPIFGSDGQTRASISLTALSSDLPAIQFATIGEKIRVTALAISKQLGYEGLLDDTFS